MTVPAHHPSQYRPDDLRRRRVTTTVARGAMADLFDAACYLEGLRPHELIRRLVDDYLQSVKDEPQVRRAVSNVRRHAIGLTAV